MNNEAFVALLDEAYKFIVSDYLERMLETTVSALNMGWVKMNKTMVSGRKPTSRSGQLNCTGHGSLEAKKLLQPPLRSVNRWRAKMSNADINLCFRVIGLEDVKYKGFKEDGKYYLAEQVRHSKSGMERMLAALLNVPVEKLAEIRKLV